MSYLVFQPEPQPEDRLTFSWKVVSAGSEVMLGRVSWYAPWRRYTYSPAGPQVLDAVCLTEMAAFLTVEMKKRKQERASGKAGE